MTDLRWELCVRRVEARGHGEFVSLATFVRPGARCAKPGDFGLSLNEVRQAVTALQSTVAQDQILAYDAAKRRCPYCGRFRRIKDWRPRVFGTTLGTVRVRVPRVVACMCLPEPLDEDGDIDKYRESVCPIEKVLPARVTPELSYLCARAGARQPYRGAAEELRELCSVRRLSHTRVRREMIRLGEHIENDQYMAGWAAGDRGHRSAQRLGLAIDSTSVTGNAWELSSKIEIVAGRVERDGRMVRRFACAVMRRTLTRMLVAAALRQSGWYRDTKVDVVNDGARGMRSLVTDVSPRVAAPMLDWFHLAMKLQAVRSPLLATYWIRPPAIICRCRALWAKIRDALWRGRGALGIELTRTLAASLAEAIPTLPPMTALAVSTARGAATRLMEFLSNNARILVDYARERRAGRRISTAPAESAMNHLVNRRMSKRQGMRWSLKGAHFMLQTRVEMLDGRLPRWFKALHPHWRSPELAPAR